MKMKERTIHWAIVGLCAWQILLWTLVYFPKASASSTYWYVRGTIVLTNFGVKETNRVKDPDVYDGHVVEACGIIFDTYNWIEVGWWEQYYGPMPGRYFFVGWMKDGEYKEPTTLYEAATPGTDAKNWIKIAAFGSEVWKAYFKGKYKKSITFPGWQWATKVRSMSEVYLDDRNTLKGYHQKLKWGGAYMSYFVWYDWSDPTWRADYPYYFREKDDTWFKSGGPS